MGAFPVRSTTNDATQDFVHSTSGGYRLDKTLLKGLQVFSLVADAEESVRIVDVAQILNLTKSNAYRTLKTLEIAGFIKQDPKTKAFFPSWKIWEYGTRVINRVGFRSSASGALKTLAEKSRETVHLAVLDGHEVIHLDMIDSQEPVRANTPLGGRAPAYCTATGKAMLAQLSEAELVRLLVDLKPFSASTITDPVELMTDLADVRVNGYAINRGEFHESVWGLAAPITNVLSPEGMAAVGVFGPRYRLENEHRISELAILVKNAASEIRRSLRISS